MIISQTYETPRLYVATSEECDLISTSGFFGEEIPLPHETNEEELLKKLQPIYHLRAFKASHII